MSMRPRSSCPHVIHQADLQRGSRGFLHMHQGIVPGKVVAVSRTRLMAGIAWAAALAFMHEAAGAQAGAGRLVAEVSPIRKSYASGEPIALRLVIRNLLPQPRRVSLVYPCRLGVAFLCRDPDAVQPALRLRVLFRGRLPSVEIPPGGKHEAVFALNRYITFRRPKTYRVLYITEHRPAKRPSLCYRNKGAFSVTVTPQRPSAEALRQLGRAVDAENEAKRPEAVELLLWLDDPSAVQCLEKAAKAVPDAAADIVYALGKFAADGRGRSIFLKMADPDSPGNAVWQEPENLRAGLLASRDFGVKLPREFLVKALRSTSLGPLLPLMYLERHGDASHVDLVRPFLGSKDPAVADSAAEFIRKVGDAGK